MKINIKDDEWERVKTFCDYIFFDEYKDTCSFPHFEKCLAFLFINKGISLSKVFREICGPKRKYITFPRFIRAFLEYKNLPGKTSIDLKNFFGHWKTLIKPPMTSTGAQCKKGKRFSAQACASKDYISQISVLYHKVNGINGMKIEYDDSITSHLVQRSDYKQSEVKLEMLMGLWDEDLDKSKRSNTRVYERAFRDSITHIFGTFTNQIDFLGFKCRSGKMQFIGKPSGEPFWYGAFGKQFHYVKLEIDKAITQIKPYFEDSPRVNTYLRIGINEINLDFWEKEPLVLEEACMSNLKTEKDIDKFISNSIVDDDFFFNKKLKDQICGSEFRDICEYEPRQWTLDENVNIKKENGEWMSLNELMNSSVPIPERKKKKRKDRKQQKKLRSAKPETWNGVSTKNTSCGMFLRNKDNYKKWMNKMESDIKTAIKQEHIKNDIETNKNFYDEYLRTHEEFKDRKDPSPKRVENVHKEETKLRATKQLHLNKNKLRSRAGSKTGSNPTNRTLNSENLNRKEIKYRSNKSPYYYSRETHPMFEDDYDDFFCDFKQFEKEFMSEFNDDNDDYNYEPEDKWSQWEQKFTHREQRNRFYIPKYDDNPEAVKKAQTHWKELSKKLSLNQGLHIIQTIGAVIRATKVLQNSEDNFCDKSLSIKDKIKLYQLLNENIRIIEFLSQPKPEPESEEESDDEFADFEEEQVNDADIGEVNSKIVLIQEYLKDDISERKRAKWNTMLQIYKRRKNTLIEEQAEKERQEIIKQNKLDLSSILNDEKEKRKKKMQENNDFINNLANIATKKVIEKGRRRRKNEKKIITDVKTVSVLTAPSPKKVYKNQELFKGPGDFTDPWFPPKIESLCDVDKRGNFILPPDGIPEDVEGWEEFKWCRAEEVFGTQDYEVFHDGIDEDDIIQGSLGDCYFLSAIGALAEYPSQIEKLFYIREKSKEHCYGVYLCINGVWELVLVDDYVPYTGRYSKKFAFSSSNGNELWAILLEKAWAKINGSFARVGCGGLPHEVFDVITEAYSEKFDICPKFADQIWNGLMKGQQYHFIMTAGTSGDTSNLDIEDMGLVPAHAYTVKQVYEVTHHGKKVKLLSIRNPWAQGEWSGEWCDSDEKWTPAIKAQMGIDD